jgi:hypothetical protein
MNEEYEDFNELFDSSNHYFNSEYETPPIFYEHYDNFFEDPSN